MIFDSKLKKALKSALNDPSSAAQAIRDVAKERVRSAAEADLVVQMLRLFPLPPGADDNRTVGSALHDVAAWMQNVEGDKATAVFKQRGAPELLRVFDDAMASVRQDDDSYRTKSDLVFLLKVICMYAPAGGLERVQRAARHPVLRDG